MAQVIAMMQKKKLKKWFILIYMIIEIDKQTVFMNNGLYSKQFPIIE